MNRNGYTSALALRTSEVRLGPSNGIDTYTRGTEYFDDFESRRSTYIGPVVPASMSSEIHKSYYRAGATLVAVRVQGDPTTANNGLFYLHSDHLGSTSLTTCGTATTEGGCGGVEFGGVVSRQLYDAWGNVRVRGNLPTDIGYTGQRENADSQLVQMGARWYDPAIGRWLSPDTIVPDYKNPQSLNRFSYVRNNPLKYIDPTGHREIECEPGEPGCGANGRWLKTPPSAFIGTADQPSIQSHKDIGYSCSPTALYDLLYDLGVERRPLQTYLDQEFRSIPAAEGGLDPEYNNPNSSLRCKGNPVCTSLKVIEKVANGYAAKHNLEIIAGQNWTKEDILKLIADGIPVMVNYGGYPPPWIGHSVVIYGYDLTVEPAKGGTIYALNPSTGGVLTKTWDEFKSLWRDSDYGDPQNKTSGGDYATYKFWALAIYR